MLGFIVWLVVDRIDGVLELKMRISPVEATALQETIIDPGTIHFTSNRPAVAHQRLPGIIEDDPTVLLPTSVTEFRAVHQGGSTAPALTGMDAPVTSTPASTKGDSAQEGSVSVDTELSTKGGLSALAVEPCAIRSLHVAVNAQTSKAQTAFAAIPGGSNQLLMAINGIGDKANHFTPPVTGFSAAFPEAINAVEGFLQLTGVLAKVHPIAEVAITVLKGAYTIVQANALVHESMTTLLRSMKELCALTAEYACSKQQNGFVYGEVQGVLVEVQKAAVLVNTYAEHKKKTINFPVYFTSFQKHADALIWSFDSVCSKLLQGTVASIHSDIGVIKNSVTQLVDADKALHSGPGHGCLPGTRTAIRAALQAWAVGGSASVELNPDPRSSAPKNLNLTGATMLLLQGVAGSGKSSIAASLARYLQKARVCVAYYCFERVRQKALNSSNVFTTIAHQLATQNASLRDHLCALVESTPEFEHRSESPADQLTNFLLPLLKGDGTALNHIVVIIDALDESGGAAECERILKSLVDVAQDLPSTVRIFITTRPESHIQQVVQTALQQPNISELFMDKLPNQSTKDDIYQYLKHMLDKPHLSLKSDQLAMLCEKAQLSFQWASTACRYIMDQEDRNQVVLPYKRLTHVLSSSETADSQLTLYKLYATVMDSQFGNAKTEDLELLRLLLGALVTARKPLTLASMLQLLNVHLSQHGDTSNVKEDARIYLGLLSSLITGARDDSSSALLLPLHTSFFDFLQDATNNPRYCVDVSIAHRVLTECCFSVMECGEKKLKFNICQLTTSFLPNSSIPELPALVEDKIGETLGYACHFWASHLVSATAVTPNTLSSVIALLSTPQLLYWLEVMSLTGVSPASVLSLVIAQPNLDITAFAAEALLFTTYYAIPIALSAPHIYLSAVPFIPTLSPLQMIGEEYTRTILIPTGHLEVWPALRHVLKHQSYVFSVAVSKGGVVAAGLANGSIVLRNIQTGQQYGDPLKGHDRPVSSMAFSHNGSVLASGSWDKTIQLWDVQSQRPMGDPLRGHSGAISSITFSHDGAILASGSDDSNIQLWDVQSHKPKGDPLRGYINSVQCVAFSPDGAILASGSINKEIQLWDVQSQMPKGTALNGHSDSVTSVAFSHDGIILASGSADNTIQLWDVQSHTPKGDPLRGHTNSVQSVAFSPDGTILASGSFDHTVQLWDVVTQAPKGNPLGGHNDSVYCVAFSPDGVILASGSCDQTIQLWDVQSLTARGDPPRGHSGSVGCVAFSHDGAVLASGSCDQTIQLWDLQSQTPMGDLLRGHSGAVRSVAFTHDGAVLASGLWDDTVQLWDVQSQEPIGEPLKSHTDLVQSVALSHDRAVLASGSENATIQLWDMQSNVPKGDPLRGHSGSVQSVAFSHDGAVLASGSNDRSVRLWNITSSALDMGVPIPASEFVSFQLSPAWPELLDDGWVQGPNDELLLWVPPSYRTHLYDERLIAVLGEDPSSRVRLNFDNMVLGEDWAKCYTPLPT
ncbi:WD40 repeat-like protein [Clavulina sp. PMI_390]|nr:WD40 repeat-like protein [Clavulina sp. PMI_390]